MEGVYYDPKHGHCVRVLQRDANGDMYIMGVYGDDEAPGRPGQTWRAKVTVKEHACASTFRRRTLSPTRVYSALWCPTKRQDSVGGRKRLAKVVFAPRLGGALKKYSRTVNTPTSSRMQIL